MAEKIKPFLVIVFLGLIGIFYFKKTPSTKILKRVIREKQYFCNLGQDLSNITFTVMGIDWKIKQISIWSFNHITSSLKEVTNSLPPKKDTFTENNNILQLTEDDESESNIVLMDYSLDRTTFDDVSLSNFILSKKQCPWDKDSPSQQIQRLFSKSLVSILCHETKNLNEKNILILNHKKNTFELWSSLSHINWSFFNLPPTRKGIFKIKGANLSLESENEKNLFSIGKKTKNQLLDIYAGDIKFEEDNCYWITMKNEIEKIDKNRDSFYCNQAQEKEGLQTVIFVDLQNSYFEYFSSRDLLFHEPTTKGKVTKEGSNLKFHSKEIELKGNLDKDVLLVEKIEFKNEFCQF